MCDARRAKTPNEAPCESTVRRLVTKFKTTGLVLTMKFLDGNVFVKLRSSSFQKKKTLKDF